jgi:hypothetical protein
LQTQDACPVPPQGRVMKDNYNARPATIRIPDPV